MPTILRDGNEVDIFKILPPLDGEVDIGYGRIGSGKTSLGTTNVWNELCIGQIVFANWNVAWEGYDETKIRYFRVLGYLGLKHDFYNFPRENFHFWNFVAATIDGKTYEDFLQKKLYVAKAKDDDRFMYLGAAMENTDPEFKQERMGFIDVLTNLTDCSIHLDEGHIPFDSYEAARMNERKRSAVFGTRHFNRSLMIYTQRAMSVHVNLRGNANRFYKCEKTFDTTIPIINKRFIHFLVTQFQDLNSQQIPDESRDDDGEYLYAISQRRYWGNKNLFAKFDSKYLRGDMAPSQRNFAEISTYSLSEIWKHRYKTPPRSDDQKYFDKVKT